MRIPAPVLASAALVPVVVLVPLAGLASGSHYGVPAGARDIAGKITEWPVPTAKFARDPAIGPTATSTSRSCTATRSTAST